MTTESPATKKRKMSLDADASSAPSLLIKRLSDKAKLPTRGSALSAGYDLYRYHRVLLARHCSHPSVRRRKRYLHMEKHSLIPKSLLQCLQALMDASRLVVVSVSSLGF